MVRLAGYRTARKHGDFLNDFPWASTILTNLCEAPEWSRDHRGCDTSKTVTIFVATGPNLPYD